MTRPLIGITAADGDSRGLHALRVDYVRSVELAGALPVALFPLEEDAAGPLLARLDALVLSGGGDLDPAVYGAHPHPRLGSVSPRRDAFELRLLREALRRDLPVLAICRGLQLLNVAMGGTLLQDIPSEWKGASDHDSRGPRDRCTHEVHLQPGSRLHAILGREALAVNSFHHQAIDRLGEGLVVCARCPADQVIEGVELPGHRFVLAVQWHPESFWRGARQSSALFSALVEACRS